MLSINDARAYLAELHLEEFGQEILLLVVFFAAYHAWRRAPTLQKNRASGKAADCAKDHLHPRSTLPCLTSSSLNKPCSSPSVWITEGEQQLMQLLGEKEFTRAIQLFRRLERRLVAHGTGEQFSLEALQALVRTGIRVGHFDVVRTLFPAVCRLQDGGQSVCDFWYTTLKMLAFRKRFDCCLDVYRLYRERLPEDKVIYSCLINAALEVGDVTLAQSMLPAYTRSELDVGDHVVIFRTCLAAIDVDSAIGTFRKLSWQTTPLMFNHVLSTCVEAKQPAYAFELVSEAHALEKANGTRIVDVVSYNVVMKGFAQNLNRRECFRCVEQMESMGLQPDDVSINTLVEACVADNAFDTASGIIESLSENGPVDVITYTVLVKSLLRAGRLTKALRIYQDIKKNAKSPPDVVFFSMLIKALIDQCQLDEALSVVRDMQDAGHSIDDIILTHLLDGCRREARLELGKKFFQEALKSGVSPSEYSLVMMLKLYGSHGCHQDAYNLLSKMKTDHNIAPSVAHYTCVASGCFRSGNVDTAWLVCEALFKSGINVDEMAVSTLIQGFTYVQQWSRVVALANWTAEASPTAIAPRVLNKALSQLRQSCNDDAQDSISKLEQVASRVNSKLAARSVGDAKPKSSEGVSPASFARRRH